MRKYNGNLNIRLKMKIPTDKILHFLVSALLVCLFHRWFSMNVAVLATIAIGVLKEVFWDWLMHKGTPEFMDIFSDVVGAFMGVLLVG